jgi:cyclophilin family peptidyl-prolyl cis-trans isomerase
MNRFLLWIISAICLAISLGVTRSDAQDSNDTPEVVNPAESGKDKTPNELTRGDKALVSDAPAADADAAARANATFNEKFTEYKNALREIEKLNVEYQLTGKEPPADDAAKTKRDEQRRKINEQLTAQVAHAQSLVNAMVDAAMAAYRISPNADPKIAELLVAVAKYYTIGRQVGPGEPNPQQPEDVYFPIDGGDQYERALPIIKLLIEGGSENKHLYVWGFLAAYATNEYDLAAQYLEKAKESGALQEIAEAAQKDPAKDQEAGLMQGVLMLASAAAQNLDEYRDHWAKESEIRAAEAKADDLPRVKLTTTKGEITIELFENEAPQSVASFISLVKQGFYNNTPFHRVLPKFMAQGGDPTGTGTGGPGCNIRGETNLPNHRKHFRGTLSMAHSGHPDSGGSQFFLTFVPTPHLNSSPRGGHTAFGRVVEGMEVLADLQRRSSVHQQNPPEPDKIIKAEVLRDRGHEYKFDKLPER